MGPHVGHRVGVEMVTTVRKVGLSEVVGETKEVRRLKVYMWSRLVRDMSRDRIGGLHIGICWRGL